MPDKISAQAGPRSFTLRRDKKGALKFNGERLNSATRNHAKEDDLGETKSYEISARLFKTTGGKYVVGVEVYNRTDEEYLWRDALADDSLKDLAPRCSFGGWLDDDILGELFEDTDIGDSFMEHID